MPNLIPLKEFENSQDVNFKLNILFSYVSDIYASAQDGLCQQHEICQKHWNICHVRFTRIEKRKKMDTTLSSIMGFAGGAVAWLFKAIIGK